MAHKKNDKSVLLNLDKELYEQMASAAKSGGLSMTEYIRDAIKAKLGGPVVSALQPALDSLLLDEPPFDPTPTAVQTSDKSILEWWTERCEGYRTMGGAQALAALMRDTGGVKPPAYVFHSIESLAEWLTANIGEGKDGKV